MVAKIMLKNSRHDEIALASSRLAAPNPASHKRSIEPMSK
jgi:hypothetical protein